MKIIQKKQKTKKRKVQSRQFTAENCLGDKIAIKTISVGVQGVPESQMLSGHLINIKFATVVQIAMFESRLGDFV